MTCHRCDKASAHSIQIREGTPPDDPSLVKDTSRVRVLGLCPAHWEELKRFLFSSPVDVLVSADDVRKAAGLPPAYAEEIVRVPLAKNGAADESSPPTGRQIVTVGELELGDRFVFDAKHFRVSYKTEKLLEAQEAQFRTLWQFVNYNALGDSDYSIRKGEYLSWDTPVEKID